jgi:nucleoporin NUP82
MALNPNGKFLAVAGTQKVSVVVLPRAGFTKLVPSLLDCKYACFSMHSSSEPNRHY